MSRVRRTGLWTAYVASARILVRCLVVSDLRLSDVLSRRGVLAPAEVVTLVVALALDLADLHAAGRTHGAVCADAVRFDPDGRPRLCLGGSGAPAADVRDLAALGYLALGDRQPARLVEALQSGLDERCDARELAESVLASGPAAPLRLPWPQERCETTRQEPGRSTSSKVLVLAVAVMLPISLVLLRRHACAPTQWKEVLAGLDRARLSAIVDRRIDELSAIYVSASSQRDRDAQLIRSLVRDAVTVRGRLPELTSPRQLSRSGNTAVLSVLEQPATYVLVDAHGRVHLSVHDTKPHRLVIHLRRTRNGWRVTTVG